MYSESRSRSRSPNNRAPRNDKMPDAPPSNKVYVTFLPEDIDEQELREVFQQAGQVARIYIKKKDDGFTFAYVTYNSIEEADKAIAKLNRRKIGDKAIRVQFSRERQSDSSKGGDRRQSSRDGNNRGNFKGNRQSDTRKKFDNGGRDNFEMRGRGGSRGGGDRPSRGGHSSFGDDRKPMKCFKCQGEGHISRNCPNDQASSNYDPPKKSKPEKMSEDEFCDY